MSAIPTFDEDQLSRWFGVATLIKGMSYADRVRALQVDGAELEAAVKGTRQKPYQVRIVFPQGRVGAPPKGICTCPVAYDCKHVVAALLVWRARQQAMVAAAHPRDLPVDVASRQTHLQAAPSASLPTALLDWLDELETFRDLAASNPAPEAAKPPRTSRDALTFLIGGFHPGQPAVKLFKSRLTKEGSVADHGQAWDNVEAALLKPPQFVREEDLAILRLLWSGRSRYRELGYALQGPAGVEALRAMVASGRAFAADDGRAGPGGGPLLLTPGVPRAASIIWQESANGRVQPVLDCGLDKFAVLQLQPWWYVDMIEGASGPLALPCDSALLRRLLAMPAATLDVLPALREAFDRRLPQLPPPPALALDQVRWVASAPVPVLMLETQRAFAYGQVPWLADGQVDLACVAFDYAGVHVGLGPSPALLRDGDGALVRLERDPVAEHAHHAVLPPLGLRPLAGGHLVGRPAIGTPVLTLARATDWPEFMRVKVPLLRAQGWRIVMSDTFRHNVKVIEMLEGVVREEAGGWFDLELGVRLDGRVLRMEPLLAALFARDPRWLDGSLERIADSEVLELDAASHGRLMILAARLKPVVRALIDLFQAGESLRVPRADSGRLELLADSARWEFAGEAGLAALAERLRASPRVQPVVAPDSLQATLRPYQLEGLAWMQFLRSQQLGGVLADDMGLGKTVQALAHILTEQAGGRLDRPALILMPTSLVGNWKSEAARFAPSLRVLDLHGPQRHARFAQIPQHDLVLSTYPLVWRDQAALAAHDYHLLILDEAQQVKNTSSRAAAALRSLRARHRLCLTGTPLENHLGELWSQFDFLLPGFLGSQRDFTARWRNPIEKGGDSVRGQLLARRVGPFMLRRRKSDVATELPAKVEMLRTVEFEDSQRDLYETVRSAMQREVLDVVHRQGLGRSQIEVLTALLKLRQVCCDPRLVGDAVGHKVTPSAKLELLLEMLPELVADGRRILLFSQFTSMLALISSALDKAAIAHVLLTGDTRDRETPVARFQSGAVPVFLISLRAGGVGLNLTMADTVIHYDPWWNPAVEQQATDRAHRIGQTSTVFVYKLIAAGTVEEKILSLQQRKAELASAILGDGQAAGVRFSDQDLDDLFAPLPEVAAR